MIKNPKRLCLFSKLSYKQKFVLGFLRALRTINRQQKSSSSSLSPRQICERYLKVKKAADASMAVAVGSTRAWSRALLGTDVRGKFRRTNKRANNKICLVGRTKPSFRRSFGANLKKKVNGNFKENELRKVVPGGEAMDMCNLLDETAHYIKCLTTQVKLMRGIFTHFYSAI